MKILLDVRDIHSFEIDANGRRVHSVDCEGCKIICPHCEGHGSTGYEPCRVRRGERFIAAQANAQ